jgi:hemoglobin-like flavoprotein
MIVWGVTLSRMPLDKVQLLASLSVVVTCEPKALHYFYELLFQRHPRARELFHRPELEAQQKLLFDALSWSIEHLDDPAALERVLGALGRKHFQYGVTPDMYEWVGEALIDTIAHVSGVVWTEELAEAWRGAYSRLVDAMLVGAIAGREP